LAYPKIPLLQKIKINLLSLPRSLSLSLSPTQFSFSFSPILFWQVDAALMPDLLHPNAGGHGALLACVAASGRLAHSHKA